MDRILFTAAGGAARTLEHQASIAHNMANASTAGFRAQIAHYRAVPLVGEGLPTRVGTVAATPGSNFAPGPMQSTGRDLDVAIQGDGFIAVQSLDGTEAYTRAGGLNVGGDGTLQTAQGRPVLSEDGQPIGIPAGARVTIGADGTVTAMGLGDAPVGLAALGRIKLVDPPLASVVRGGDGLFRVAGEGAGAPLPLAPQVRVASGVIEGSNVNPVEAMVTMIDNGRRFEMQMKVVQHAEANAERANSLLSANG